MGYSADMEWDRMLTFNSFREEKNNIIGVNSNAVGLYSQKEKKITPVGCFLEVPQLCPAVTDINSPGSRAQLG